MGRDISRQDRRGHRKVVCLLFVYPATERFERIKVYEGINEFKELEDKERSEGTSEAG